MPVLSENRSGRSGPGPWASPQTGTGALARQPRRRFQCSPMPGGLAGSGSASPLETPAWQVLDRSTGCHVGLIGRRRVRPWDAERDKTAEGEMWLPGRKEAGPRPEGADVSHRRGAGCCAKPFTLFLTGRLPVRPASPVSDRTPTCPMPTAKISRAGAYVRPAIGAAVV